MVAEDFLHLGASSRKTAFCDSSSVRSSDVDIQTTCSKVEDGIFEMDGLIEADNGKNDKSPVLPPGENRTLIELDADFSKIDPIHCIIDGANQLVADVKEKANTVSSISGKKRPRMDEEPSVRIIYSSLTRNSKRKLEELLNIWSEWHAQNTSSVQNPMEEASEFGEEIYYPALHVDAKRSTVSFCLDNQVRKRQCRESLSLKDEFVPFYDRDYAVGLTPNEEPADPNTILNIREASRCFNCGSYTHSLDDCPKPRDTVSINNARKEFQSKRTKRSVPRVHTRYYQSSPSEKYDGLKPGCLAAETREALGLGQELDPPPWLHRMRQLGYPPGYLDPEDEDESSGLTIYDDEETGNANTDNVKSNITVSRSKMSVDFPGMNALIPEKADQKKWSSLQVQIDTSESLSRSFNTNRFYQSPVASPNTSPWTQNYASAPSPRYGHWSSSPIPVHPISPYDLAYSSRWSSPQIPIHRMNHHDSSTYSSSYLSPMSISVPSRPDYRRPLPHAGFPFSPPSSSLPNSEPPPPGSKVVRNPWPVLLSSGSSFRRL